MTKPLKYTVFCKPTEDEAASHGFPWNPGLRVRCTTDSLRVAFRSGVSFKEAYVVNNTDGIIIDANTGEIVNTMSQEQTEDGWDY